MNLPRIAVLGIVFVVIVASSAIASVEDAVVKVYVTSRPNNYFLPWSLNYPEDATGSGCVITGNRILTNAHVVQDHTFIQVRRYGFPDRYEAKVVAVSHPADLAILTVEDPAFFKGIKPLKIGKLPALKSKVNVYGYPTGGDNISITEGVVSRIETTLYAHSLQNIFSAQLDAAVNGGNSGGPAISDGKLVGVIMQGLDDAENTNYMVPAPVVEHFLKDINDGHYDGIPSVGVKLQDLENPDARKFYRLSEDISGQLITNVFPGMPADGVLKVGDVIIKVDGKKIANDGTVEFRPKEWTAWSYYVQEHQIGETVELSVVRNGQAIDVELKLSSNVDDGRLVTKQINEKPTYYIYGGIVFTPVSFSLMRAYDDNDGYWIYDVPDNLVNLALYSKPQVAGEEAIIISEVLTSSVNQGYEFVEYERVVEVNGQRFNDLGEMIDIIERSQSDEFVVFKLNNAKNIVINRSRAEYGQAALFERYSVPADRSEDLLEQEKIASSQITK